MKIPLYQIDAFTTGKAFSGNPAAVCFLDAWLPDPVLQAIAEENNLSETAFLVAEGERWGLRWFTPAIEMDLCGHATLAAAFAILSHRAGEAERIEFSTRSGIVSVERRDDLLVLDFPSRKPRPCEVPEGIGKILGEEPRCCLRSRDLIAVFDQEEQIRRLTPNMAGIAALDAFAVIATAPGTRSDFVSRFFAPGAGVTEDPVTGSAHCSLIPYWAERLGKRRLHAFQLSRRGGELFCADEGERVSIGGRARTFLVGTMEI